jgi:hypothetical protein
VGLDRDIFASFRDSAITPLLPTVIRPPCDLGSNRTTFELK